MADYSKMTDEDFDMYMYNILEEEYGFGAIRLLNQFPQFYEDLKEEFNNSILDMWANDNPGLAFPEDYKEER